MSRIAVFSFLAAIAVAPLPVQAETNASLAARVAALEASVAKLQGQIVANDLLGTYALVGVQTDLDASNPAAIQSTAFSGTVTLAADGNGSMQLNGNGINLILGNPASELPIQSQDASTFHWTYANGSLTVTEAGVTFNVGAGGRLLTYAALSDNNTVDLFILTRLQ